MCETVKRRVVSETTAIEHAQPVERGNPEIAARILKDVVDGIRNEAVVCGVITEWKDLRPCRAPESYQKKNYTNEPAHGWNSP
jgi:hypothetical protein